MPSLYVIAALVLASVLEVWGDRTIGRGLNTGRAWLVGGGCLLLALYGIAVNAYNSYIVKQGSGEVPWDFGRLLGFYVAFFALTAVIWSLVADKPKPSAATIIGAIVIAIGGAIIQLGNR